MREANLHTFVSVCEKNKLHPLLPIFYMDLLCILISLRCSFTTSSLSDINSLKLSAK